MIWSIVEGFGGPYKSGSTDIGAAIMYALTFVTIIIVERSSNYSKYSLDALIERKLNGWKHLAFANNMGAIIAAQHRGVLMSVEKENEQSLLTEDELELSATESVLRMVTRTDMMAKLGKPIYSFT